MIDVHVSFIAGCINYTSMFNVLNYPAGVVPAGYVTQEDVANMEDYQAGYYVKDRIKEVFNSLYRSRVDNSVKWHALKEMTTSKHHF